MLDRLLDSGLAELSLSLDKRQQEKLIRYLQLLEKWNHTYNLTAVESAADRVSLHLLDSLSVLPYLSGDRFVDVGSGAGLPGIPLAVAMPDKVFTLLDSNAKRTRFLLQVKTELELDNIKVVHCRAESYKPAVLFDSVLSRAYASLSQMIEYTAPLCDYKGHFFAMKGQYPQKELRDLPKGFNVERFHELRVPGVIGDRHLIVICRSQP